MSIGWGVIGAGGIADRRTIPEGILPAANAELVAVMGVHPERTSRIAAKYGVPGFTRVEDLLACDEVQAVYIAVPTYRHCDLAVQAMRAGKHVLCEKPMAMNPAECEQMIAVAEETQRKLAIGYMMRFHACHRKLKEMIDAGELGTLVMGRAQLTCWYPRIEGAWRQDPALGGGGALMDMGSHCIDLLEMFCGPAREVTALSGNLVQDYPVEDSMVVALRFASGALGIVDCHFNVPDEASVNMLEMYGSRGRVESRGTIGQGSTGFLSAVLATEAKGYEAAQKREEGGAVIIQPEVMVNIYQAEIEDVSEAILHDREPTVTGADGLWGVRVCQAAYQSAAEGRTVKLG